MKLSCFFGHGRCRPQEPAVGSGMLGGMFFKIEQRDSAFVASILCSRWTQRVRCPTKLKLSERDIRSFDLMLALLHHSASSKDKDGLPLASPCVSRCLVLAVV